MDEPDRGKHGEFFDNFDFTQVHCEDRQLRDQTFLWPNVSAFAFVRGNKK